MKRKVNRVGSNTLTVSLPSRWTKQLGIKPGDELELVEDSENLVIGAKINKKRKEIAINISKLGIMAGRVLGALYKSGYDEIKIEFDNPKMIEIVQKELMKGFIGVDIIHHSKNYCILKSIATVNPNELDNSIRRVFRLLIENSKDSLEAIKKKDYSELENVAYKDMNLNKFADFSRRLLNKFNDSRYEKLNLVYIIIENLEKIGDKYRDLCTYISKNRINLSKERIILYNRVNYFLILFYELFYNYNDERCAELGNYYKKLHIDIEKCYNSIKKDEVQILAILQSIADSIFDLNGPLLTSRFK
ncbi:MAG: AbrB/MazE/SpoVT family DNA-binding domain-containing protein [Nanoarchaeota archaeon]|nr:AbrB/MazE/SpoVT family DNA-binding domain-containing protein [Nanoarchaeota archaeon]